MKPEWENIIKNITEFQETLEDLLDMLPFGKKYFKSKQKIEKQWREISRSIDKMDPYISDLIEAIEINHPWINDEFINTWKLYKDFLFEQHGLRMKSRMEQQRIEWLMANTKNDYKKAISWLKYFMARGSEGLYIVKIENTEDGKTELESKKAGFTLPKK